MPGDVKRGDIILYRSQRGVIAHRVVSLPTHSSVPGPDPLFLLRGDASLSCDEPVEARQILGRDKAETRQIIVITDGEPTTYSYWMDDDWDNPRGGMEQTLREVVRCTKDGITFNTFMMGRDPGAARFVGTVTKLNKGRAFLASADRLGQYVVTDYINSKRKVID